MDNETLINNAIESEVKDIFHNKSNYRAAAKIYWYLGYLAKGELFLYTAFWYMFLALQINFVRSVILLAIV